MKQDLDTAFVQKLYIYLEYKPYIRSDSQVDTTCAMNEVRDLN